MQDDWMNVISKAGSRVLVVADIKNINFGDRLIFNSLVTILKQLGVDKVFKLANHSTETEQVIYLNAFNPLKLFLGLTRCSSVVLGGGGIFQDETSKANLVYFGLIVLLAKLLFKPIYVIGVGVSDLRYSSSGWLVSFICHCARFVAVRDEDSKKLLKKYFRGDVQVMPDLALYYQFDESRVSNGAKKLAADRLCLLTLRPQNAGSGRIDNERDETLFLTELANQIEKILKGTDIKPLVIAFDRDKDVDYIKNYIDRFDKVSSAVINDISPDDYCYLAERSNYVISMRLHGAILAYQKATSIVALEYDSKLRHFMRSIQQEQMCLHLNEIEKLSGKLLTKVLSS